MSFVLLLCFLKSNSIWTKFQPFSCARDLSLMNLCLSSFIFDLQNYLFIYLFIYNFYLKFFFVVICFQKPCLKCTKFEFFSCLRDFFLSLRNVIGLSSLVHVMHACMRAIIFFFCRKNFKSIQRAPRESRNSDAKRIPIFWSHYRKRNGAGANTRWFASIACHGSWAIFQKAQICNFPL